MVLIDRLTTFGERVRSLLLGVLVTRYGLQKIVGLTVGFGGLVVVVMRTIDLSRRSDFGIELILFDRSIIPVFVAAIVGVICGYWKSKVAGWIHVILSFIISYLGTLTSEPGNLTSAMLLIFGLILIAEYNLGGIAAYLGAIAALLGYPLLLVIGYQTRSQEWPVQVTASLFGVAVFVVLYGAVLLRHFLRHRDEAALLESRVKERTAKLEEALAERAVMLQEIHHRVKNNLQIVASLLQLEANKLADPRSREPMEASIQRIHTMALVHQTLYAADRIESIELRRYIEKLVEAIRELGNSAVEFLLDVKGPIHVGLDSAIPLGLILNELLTNSMRHAFPRGRLGHVRICITTEEGLKLTVADDGVGIAEDFRSDEVRGLGLMMVGALTEQLRGSLSLDRSTGTSWTLSLPAVPVER